LSASGAERLRAPSARRTEYRRQAVQSVVTRALETSGTEYRHRSIEPGKAPTARRAQYRQRAEQSIVTGASSRAMHRQQDERSTVSERSGASSPVHWSRAQHRQRDRWSMVSKPGGSWSVSQAEHGQRAWWSIVSEPSNEPCRASSVSRVDGQAEYWQWAKWSIVTGASEPNGAPTAEYRAEWSIFTGALSRTEHYQSDERSTVSERSGVMSAS
jgi:hypothetical protein